MPDELPRLDVLRLAVARQLDAHLEMCCAEQQGCRSFCTYAAWPDMGDDLRQSLEVIEQALHVA